MNAWVINRSSIRDLDFARNKNFDRNVIAPIKHRTTQEMIGKAELKQSDLFINVPGFSHICDTKKGIARCIFWGTAFFLSFVLCIYQIANRIQEYREVPVTTEMKIFRNNSLRYPSFTLCKTSFDSPEIKKLRQEVAEKTNTSYSCRIEPASFLDYTNCTLDELWEFNDVNKSISDIMFYSLTWVSTQPKMKKSKEIFSHGFCQTHTLIDEVEYQGSSMHLIIVMHSSECSQGFSILLHDEPFFPKYYMSKIGHYFMKEKNYVMGVSVKQTRSISTPSSPCEPSEKVQKCYDDCFDNILEAVTYCKLPYMTFSQMKDCSNSSEYLQTYKETKTAYIKRISGCKCPRQCDETFYSIQTKTLPLPTANYRGKALVDIYFESPIVEIFTERASYGLVSLFCDIGGNLGLFLGICTMTLLEILEDLIAYIRTRMNAVLYK